MAFWEGVGDPCDRDGVVLMIVVVFARVGGIGSRS
jgi:hypothetical protein